MSLPTHGLAIRKHPGKLFNFLSMGGGMQKGEEMLLREPEPANAAYGSIVAQQS
jgi:hypothetical protein